MAIATKIRAGTQSAGLGERLISGNADFRSLAEAIGAAIFISRGTRLHYVNHAAESITGYTRQELLSMSFADLVHPDSRQLVGNCASGLPGNITHREIRILANGGEVRWLEITTATVELNGVPSDEIGRASCRERV